MQFFNPFRISFGLLYLCFFYFNILFSIFLYFFFKLGFTFVLNATIDNILSNETFEEPIFSEQKTCFSYAIL